MIVGDTPDMEALRRLDLPRAEREILALLLRTRLEWVSQEEMLEVLAPRTEINSNSLQSHISKLRRRACVRIECARYLGYRLGEDDRRRLLGQLGMADPRHQEPP
jgi:DNA-binding response OmpR family regulator